MTLPEDNSFTPGPELSLGLVVEAERAGRRLDVYLAERRPELSRSLLARMIKSGRVTLNGQPVKPSVAVEAGQAIRLRLPEPPPLQPRPDAAVPFTVVYQDSQLLVVDKPAGVVVHPAAGNYEGTLAAGLLAYDPGLALVGPEGRPGLAHRLDKDTSGLLVVARTGGALGCLGRAFSERRVTKIYLALTHGLPRAARGLIDVPIGRHPTRRHKMSPGAPAARPARTHYQLLKSFGGRIGLLKLRLETGRTHQIRVHLAHLGCPVLADPVYGRPLSALTGAGPFKERPDYWLKLMGRQMLHARRLTFRHPASRAILTVRAPWPQDMLALFKALNQAFLKA